MLPSLARSLASLYRPLAVMLLALAGGYLLTSQSLEHYRTAQQQLQGQEHIHRQARDKLQRSGSEKSTIEQFLPAYQSLQQQGMIGAEQRINWVDALRSVNRSLKLYGINYQIDAQKPFQGGGGMPGTFRVYQSDMLLHFGLLHENDLLNFFEQLRQTHVGLFQIEQCTLQRIPANNINFGMQPNLEADCTLRWLTLQPNRGAP